MRPHSTTAATCSALATGRQPSEAQLWCRGLLLDATAKGGLARYLNHSCGPNCETQYWMVKGETRVGIFARQAIKAGTELCYDYNLQWNGFARVRCALSMLQCNLVAARPASRVRPHRALCSS